MAWINVRIKFCQARSQVRFLRGAKIKIRGADPPAHVSECWVAVCPCWCLVSSLGHGDGEGEGVLSHPLRVQFCQQRTIDLLDILA